MTKIRILALTKSTGGIAFYNKLLLGALDPDRFETHTICLSENAETYAQSLTDIGLGAETLEMERYRINLSGDMRVLRHIRRVARDWGADVILCHGAKAGFLGRVAARLEGLEAIYCQASMPFLKRVQGKKAPYYWLLEHLGGRFGGTLVAITDHARRETRARRVLPDAGIRVIRTGIDTEKFRPRDQRDKAALKMGLDPKRPIVGWLGRFEPQKAPMDYVKALTQVAPRHPDAQFVMAGEGRMRDEVEAALKSGALPGNVSLLPWQSDPALSFQAMDIYALSSHWEGLPLTLLEAMSTGCAPVSTTVDGCAEAIEDGVSGLLVPPGDTAAMAQALDRMLSDEDMRALYAASARSRVLELFDRRRMVREWEALFTEKSGHNSSTLRKSPRRPVTSHHAPMKICMVISSYHPVVGGAEKQLAQLARLMVDQGHHLRIITRRYPGLAPFEVIDGVEVQRIRFEGGKAFGAARFLFGAAAAIRKFAPDVIHCHSTFSPTLAGLLGNALTRRPLIAKPMCGGEVDRVVSKPGGRLRLQAMKSRVSGFACVSREIETELQGLGIPDDRLLRIPNGVDCDRFHPAATPEEKTALRKELGLPEDGPLVLFAGRIARQKRLPLLLEAWPQVRAACPKATLLIAGANRQTQQGHQADNGDADAVDPALLDQPGVTLLGHVDDMPSHLRAADVFVLPSAREGLSNAMLEACASGLAVVASDVGGTEDVIRNGENGRLFAPDDQEGLTRALCDLLTAPDLRHRLGEAAAATVAQRFDIRLTADRLLSAYADLQDRHPDGHPRLARANSGT